MRGTILRSLAGIVALVAAAGCTISKVEPPPLTGPSELALSLQLQANPDTIYQDGASQSLIKITARGPNGEPARSVALRAEISIGGQIVDFGRLSARNLVTDNNGQATLVYTAPPFVGDPVDTFTVVTILVTPAETDNRNSFSRQLDIRLIPPGVLLPPNQPPVPNFTFTPATPTVNESVVFDGTASTDPDAPAGDAIVSYVWDFGDGATATGPIARHEFRTLGTYSVTLTVTDTRGVSRSAARTVSVGPGTGPSALFSFSPSAPAVNQEIVFNASASRAAPGRRIVSYEWNFGSGSPKEGQVVTKSYDTPGTYSVTLTVTDDAGLSNTVSQQVPVSETGGPSPTASFTFSPTNPRVGDTVFFNASASQSPNGIVSYLWDFGDGTTGTGVTTNHVYVQSRTYTVVLTVIDGAGRRDTATQTINVQ